MTIPRVYEYQGRRYHLTQLADMASIDVSTLKKRLQRGWSIDAAMRTQKRSYYKGDKRGQDDTVQV